MQDDIHQYCHCDERGDATTQASRSGSGLLRSARNDGVSENGPAGRTEWMD
jgi:hypothetical protein